MAAKRVNGSGNGARSGAQTLILLAVPLNCILLEELSDGPKQQAELRRAAGSPAATTLRAQLKRLTEIGVIAKDRRDRFPGVLEYELTRAGRELLSVVATLEGWLSCAPDGPLFFGSSTARAAINALAEGWSTTMLRALAAGPLSLTELDGVIGSLSYPSLERRLGAMRLAGQIEARQGNGRGTPYGVTEWLRRGVAPLLAAARWERRYLSSQTASIAPLDAETTFLLPLSLLRLRSDLSGSCRLAAEIPNGGKRRLAGVAIEVDEGAISSCSTKLTGKPDAWALGPIMGWLDALVEDDSAGLDFGGDTGLARSLLDGLHQVLFKVRIKPR